eukprot:gene5681-9502_t
MKPSSIFQVLNSNSIRPLKRNESIIIRYTVIKKLQELHSLPLNFFDLISRNLPNNQVQNLIV